MWNNECLLSKPNSIHRPEEGKHCKSTCKEKIFLTSCLSSQIKASIGVSPLFYCQILTKSCALSLENSLKTHRRSSTCTGTVSCREASCRDPFFRYYKIHYLPFVKKLTNYEKHNDDADGLVIIRSSPTRKRRVYACAIDGRRRRLSASTRTILTLSSALRRLLWALCVAVLVVLISGFSRKNRLGLLARCISREAKLSCLAGSGFGCFVEDVRRPEERHRRQDNLHWDHEGVM